MWAKAQISHQMRVAIREWIRAEGLSQGEAGERLGISRAKLCHFLGGADRVALGTLLEAWERIGGEWELHLGRGEKQAGD